MYIKKLNVITKALCYKGIMLLQCLSFLFSVYFDVSQNCHTLAFSFGQTAIGTTTPTTRSFTIKVIFTNILIFFLCAQGTVIAKG